jgi:ABC-2 type transport system ATP-binding protein
MSIKVQEVSKFYGAQAALNEVSFTIGKGEIVGFLGPNGAGKSTMMKILTGYLPQSQGTAEVCGLNVAEDSRAVRQKVGYLAEHNPLYLEMYVREYLNFMGGLHQAPKSAVEPIIKKVGLLPEKHKKLGQLSKGYRQRVGLAAALLHHPEVLILDEPTTGLDPNQLVEIRNLIKEAGAEKTVMLSTHIMQEVEILCDRVIIINKGQIVANKNTADLKNLKEGTTYRIEFDLPLTASQLRKITGVASARALNENNTQWLVQAKEKQDLRSAIFKFAVAQERVVLGIKEEAQKLEQVFQELTK